MHYRRFIAYLVSVSCPAASCYAHVFLGWLSQVEATWRQSATVKRSASSPMGSEGGSCVLSSQL